MFSRDRALVHRTVEVELASQQYEIQIEGYLGDGWSEWFEGLAVGHTKDARGDPVRTILSGPMDQAMMCGVLMRICDLGLSLVSVRRMGAIDQADRHDGTAARRERK
jgi:hypothetical protein